MPETWNATPPGTSSAVRHHGNGARRQRLRHEDVAPSRLVPGIGDEQKLRLDASSGWSSPAIASAFKP